MTHLIHYNREARVTKTCKSCGTPVGELDRWCSLQCARADEGPGFGREDDDFHDHQDFEEVA